MRVLVLVARGLEQVPPRGDVRAAAQQGAAFALGHAPPDTELDPVVEGVGEALGAHRTPAADRLGAVLGRPLDEQFVRVSRLAGRPRTPVCLPHGAEGTEGKVAPNRPERSILVSPEVTMDNATGVPLAPPVTRATASVTALRASASRTLVGMSRGGATVSRMVLFVLVSVIAGVLVAGLALPLVGAVGLAARTASDSYQEIPDVLQPPRCPSSRSCSPPTAAGWRPSTPRTASSSASTEISPLLQQAVVAVEDSRFYEHDGVDLRGTLRALATNSQSGEIQQGGSTLTMQYVKNVLLTAAKTDEERAAALEQSVSRKLKEWRLATGLEKRWTKQQILEGYLNIAYFGAGAYGAEAASRRYFSRPARETSTLPQAALLAGIVQQPVAFDPLRNPKSAQARRDVVLRRMLRPALHHPGGVRRRPRHPHRGDAQAQDPPQRVLGDLRAVLLRLRLPGHPQRPGRSARPPDEREALLKQGGLVIQTTLDPKIQRPRSVPWTRRSRARTPARRRPRPSSSSRAPAPSSPWPRTAPGGSRRSAGDVDQLLGRRRSTTGRIGLQAGSTFKAFTLAAALPKGIPVNETHQRDQPEAVPGRQLHRLPWPLGPGRGLQRRTTRRPPATSTCARRRRTPSTPTSWSSSGGPGCARPCRRQRRWACVRR